MAFRLSVVVLMPPTMELSDRRCEENSIVSAATELPIHSEREAIATVH